MRQKQRGTSMQRLATSALYDSMTLWTVGICVIQQQ